jgi:hypothetical protein
MDTQTTVKKLPASFILKGEPFEQVFENETHYIYKRIHAETDYFEVFRKKLTRCFDFETKKPTGELKEKYPRDEDFGKWAWCCRSFERAMSYTNI